MITVLKRKSKCSKEEVTEYTVSCETVQTGRHPLDERNVNRVIKRRMVVIRAFTPKDALEGALVSHRWAHTIRVKPDLSYRFDPRYTWQQYVVTDPGGKKMVKQL